MWQFLDLQQIAAQTHNLRWKIFIRLFFLTKFSIFFLWYYYKYIPVWACWWRNWVAFVVIFLLTSLPTLVAGALSFPLPPHSLHYDFFFFFFFLLFSVEFESTNGPLWVIYFDTCCIFFFSHNNYSWNSNSLNKWINWQHLLWTICLFDTRRLPRLQAYTVALHLSRRVSATKSFFAKPFPANMREKKKKIKKREAYTYMKMFKHFKYIKMMAAMRPFVKRASYKKMHASIIAALN